MADSSDVTGAVIQAVDTEAAPPLLEPLSKQQFARVVRSISRSPYYVDDATYIRIQETSNIGGVAIQYGFRRGTVDGQVLPTRAQLLSAGDLVTHTQDLQLGGGLLYNVTVATELGIGEFSIFVQVFLIQGTGPNAIKLACLVAGYITGTQSLGWPGSPVQNSIEGNGRTRQILLANPGLGHDLTVSVPLNTRWRFQAFYALFQADGTAGARQPFFNIVGTLGATLLFMPWPSTIGLGGASHCMAGEAYPWVTAPGNQNQMLPTPAALDLGPNAIIRTFVSGMALGDAWLNGSIAVLEWLECN
jgi:hypothetical protein